MVKQACTAADVDQLFATLDGRRSEWANLPAARKVQLLQVGGDGMINLRPQPFHTGHMGCLGDAAAYTACML
jgi:hypothetical protein